MLPPTVHFFFLHISHLSVTTELLTAVEKGCSRVSSDGWQVLRVPVRVCAHVEKLTFGSVLRHDGHGLPRVLQRSRRLLVGRAGQVHTVHLQTHRHTQ